jgi:hypothetical protein
VRKLERAAYLARTEWGMPACPGWSEVASEAEVEAMLKELGLPIGLIEHMQIAPAPLDDDEDQDPYGLAADAAKDATDVAAE